MNNLEDINNNITKLFKQTKLLLLIKVFVCYYIIFVSFKLNKELVYIFESVYFRILIIVCIFYCVSIDYSLAILLSIAYINSINTLNKLKTNDLLNINSIEYLSSEDLD
tara:strand:+ start:180 stop:506 length:327 start_codon:yes stop_codon:yes gene_type:complete